jgi:hypothetical protein
MLSTSVAWIRNIGYAVEGRLQIGVAREGHADDHDAVLEHGEIDRRGARVRVGLEDLPVGEAHRERRDPAREVDRSTSASTGMWIGGPRAAGRVPSGDATAPGRAEACTAPSAAPGTAAWRTATGSRRVPPSNLTALRAGAPPAQARQRLDQL